MFSQELLEFYRRNFTAPLSLSKVQDLLEFYGRHFTISPSKVEGHVLLLFGNNDGFEGFLFLELSAASQMLRGPIEEGREGFVNADHLVFAVVVLRDYFRSSQAFCESEGINLQEGEGTFRWADMGIYIQDTPAGYLY